MWYKSLVLDKFSKGDEILIITESDLSYKGVLLDAEDNVISLCQDIGDEGMITIFIEYSNIDSIGLFEKTQRK